MLIDGVYYDRVFVTELESGDVNAFGETVVSVERVTDERTRVTFDNDYTSVFSKADTTTLIRRK